MFWVPSTLARKPAANLASFSTAASCTSIIANLYKKSKCFCRQIKNFVKCSQLAALIQKRTNSWINFPFCSNTSATAASAPVEQVVDAIVSGQDVLGVMPTGAGKSVCYQVPAMLMPGLTLVISPLISLMQDQVAALEEEGVHAACTNSALPEGLYSTILRAALEGDYKILYVAPERLLTDSFLYLAMHARIAFVAVDEAHCVSQWGQDFRPSYLKIAEFISRLPYRPVIGAFTATATEQVKQDIIALLQLNQPFTLTTGFDRPNLYFGVARPRDKERYIEEYILDHRDRSGIVYCATRKSVESVCKELRSVGISATRYHAGLTPEERSKNQEDFVYDRKRVMVATNAFGMGIDKSNVSFVLHYNMPKNLENYYQEAGRAGRDGERAECILLFSLGDVQTAKYFIQNSHDNDELTLEQAEAAARRTASGWT